MAAWGFLYPSIIKQQTLRIQFCELFCFSLVKLYMQIEALFPKRFGTWTEYAKKYCNAHVRYV